MSKQGTGNHTEATASSLQRTVNTALTDARDDVFGDLSAEAKVHFQGLEDLAATLEMDLVTSRPNTLRLLQTIQRFLDELDCLRRLSTTKEHLDLVATLYGYVYLSKRQIEDCSPHGRPHTEMNRPVAHFTMGLVTGTLLLLLLWPRASV